MKVLITFFVVLFLAGCSVSKHIPRDGIMKYEEVTFPDLDKAWIEQGSFPNLENLKKIRSGMNKDQIRLLIGHPHFAEGFIGVIEWDYIFNFIDKNNEVYICQYKVIFDQDKLGRSFFFKPQACADLLKTSENNMVNHLDVLFNFAQYQVKEDDRQEIAKLVGTLDKDRIKSVMIIGHTDPIGSNQANNLLSINRAESVKAEFVKQGIAANKIKAYGAGEKEQIHFCSYNIKKIDRINCLQPNRRAMIMIEMAK